MGASEGQDFSPRKPKAPGRAAGGAGCGVYGPRSQTPFGNALAGETLFRVGGVSERAEPVRVPTRRTPPPCETEFRSHVRSQTEFGNEVLPIA